MPAIADSRQEHLTVKKPVKTKQTNIITIMDHHGGPHGPSAAAAAARNLCIGPQAMAPPLPPAQRNDDIYI
jgi:hypothetical protein